jgi:lactate dehydrogenase-like 2-hydroxyacid dehydrogenase
LTVRSDILVGPVPVAPATTHNVGPGVNETWIVRTAVLVNTRAAAVAFQIGINNVTDGGIIVAGLTVPANSRRIFEEWWVVDNPKTLMLNNAGIHPITWTVFGARLAGVAP